MELAKFDYYLPKKFIAQEPVSPRDRAKLFVIKAGKKEKIYHTKFFELGKFLSPGDLIVVNNSKVIPARLFGRKETGGKVEILLLKERDDIWEVLLKNYKKKDFPKKLFFENALRGKVLIDSPRGRWWVEFNKKGRDFREYIYQYGQAPTPPYIKKKARLSDYQTIYAKKEGSIAGPTAGFHFTGELIKKLKAKGIEFVEITLHVGRGTFAPIQASLVEEYEMEPEEVEISPSAAARIKKAKGKGRRIIAVGTTVVRTLEDFAEKGEAFGKREVDLFIFPGYKFKVVDAFITNFHLPCATPLLLTSAFYCWKKNQLAIKGFLSFYKEAVKEKYRFYSFGDAMLIL